MRSWKTYLILAAALVAVSIAATLVTTGPAIAQTIKAVIVKDIDSPARQPVFLYGQSVAGAWSGYSPMCPVIYTVPANKRFVLEYVGGKAHDRAADQLTYVQIEIGTDALVADLYYEPVETKPEFMKLAQPLRMYFEAGQEVKFCPTRYLMADNTASAAVHVAGYLIDVN